MKTPKTLRELDDMDEMIDAEFSNDKKAKVSTHGNKGKTAWNKGKKGPPSPNKGKKNPIRAELNRLRKGIPSGRKGCKLTEEQIEHHRETMKGRKWWHRKDESRLCKEKPGPDWSPGRFYK
jgi:hypothetical protein